MRKLSNKEVKELLKKLEFLQEIKKELRECYIAEINNYECYILGTDIILIKIDKNIIIPSLKLIYKLEYCPISWVKVDEGAVKRIINGADVMRPGITEISDFKKGDPICILDPKDRPIAVGIALYSSEEVKKMEKGKVIRNLHHLGDKFWQFKLKK